MDDESRQRLLAKCELFAGLDRQQLARIAALCREVKYARDREIFAEESAGTELYIIPAGRVGIELNLGPGGCHERITVVKDSEVFGELALLDGCRRSARAVALDDLELLVLDREALLGQMREDPRIGMVILSAFSRILARKLRDTNIALRNALLQQTGLIHQLPY